MDGGGMTMTTTMTTTTNMGTTSGGGRARDDAARRRSTPNPASQMLRGSQTEGGGAKETSSRMDAADGPPTPPKPPPPLPAGIKGGSQSRDTALGNHRLHRLPPAQDTRQEGQEGVALEGGRQCHQGGNKGAASARAGVAKEVRRTRILDGGKCVDALAGGSYANVLLNNLEEQDKLLVCLRAQHATLSGIVDMLIPREEGDSGEFAAA
jgi:hypothetical protein